MVGVSPILGTQQHHRHTDEDEHGKEFERETSHDERQPHQRLPDTRQTETPLLLFGFRDNIRHGGWGIGDGQRQRRRTRHIRKTRFQPCDRPPNDAEGQGFGSERASEHQRQFPRDIEQLVIGERIVRRPHDPVIERRKMRQRARQIGDLTGDIADLLRHRQQKLRAEAVRG